MKRFNNFINESDKISNVTGYGNTVMEHNNVELDSIYGAIEESIDHINSLETQLDELDVEFTGDEIQSTKDIEQIEGKSKELKELLNKALEIADELKEISEKYIQY